jgi:hypothetical protein
MSRHRSQDPEEEGSQVQNQPGIHSETLFHRKKGRKEGGREGGIVGGREEGREKGALKIEL